MRPAPLVLAALTSVAVLGTASPAAGHAEVTPTAAGPGLEVTVTVLAPVEREVAADLRRNARISTLVPQEFDVLGCTGPGRWTCRIDPDAFAPDRLVVFEPAGGAAPADIEFEIRVRTPAETAGGTYLFRTLQEHADGFVEPWVFDAEPYVSPRFSIGRAGEPRNGGDRRPACFGPAQQPEDFVSYSGRGAAAEVCGRASGRGTTPRSVVPLVLAGSAAAVLLGGAVAVGLRRRRAAAGKAVSEPGVSATAGPVPPG